MSLRSTVRERILSDMLRSVNEQNSSWKVLVVDKHTLQILNASCRVSDLMEERITVIENLHMKRQPLPTLDAVYFLTPTEESVEAFLFDWTRKDNKRLYQNAHLFFSSRLGDRLCEGIANSAVAPFIKSMKDLNLDFLAVESQVFSLNRGDLDIMRLYNPNAEGASSEKNEIAAQIVTLLATLNEAPAIRYAKNDKVRVARELATIVQKQLDEFQRVNKNWEPKTDSTLLIVGREMDTLAPVLHEFTYQAMVYDLLDIIEDKYVYSSKDGTDNPVQKTAILDEKDDLWVEYRHSHISDMIPSLKNAFQKFMSENSAGALQKKKKPTDDDSSPAPSTSELAAAVRALPQYNERISRFSLHFDITQKCTEQFRKHQLVKVAGLEQNLAMGEDENGQPLKNSLTQLAQLLRDNDIELEDKLRLTMTYIMTQGGMKDDQREQLMDMAEFSPTDQNVIRSLIYLGVQVTRESKEKRSKNDMTRKRKPSKKDDVPISLSRFVPLIKDLAESALQNKLSTAEFPYVRDPSPSGQNPRSSRPGSAMSSSSNNGGASSSSGSASGSQGATSFSLKRTAGWASNKKAAGGKEKPGKPVEPEFSGPRLIIFVAGGVTASETRSIYELSKQFKREILIGSTSLLTPKSFNLKLGKLDQGKDFDGNDDIDY